MVGVARSSSCSTCRKRKVKCDEAKPSCRKCILSDFQCPGYPFRLKFQDETNVLERKYGVRNSQGKSRHRATVPALLPSSHEIHNFPLSSSDRLVLCFCHLLASDISTGPIFPAFGNFMTSVPLHIGNSNILDLSVECFYIAHIARFSTQSKLLLQRQKVYGQALRSLQQCLESRDQARASETLCATVLLGIYETIVSTEQNATMKHAGSAMSLILVKGPTGFKDSFARDILNALRRKAIIGFITAGKECFLDMLSWKQLFEVPPSNDPHGFESFFSLVSEVPAILETFKTFKQDPHTLNLSDIELRDRAMSLRSRLLSWRASPSQRDFLQASEVRSLNLLFQTAFRYDDVAAAGLDCLYAAMMILIDAVLAQLRMSDLGTDVFRREARKFATHICQSYEYYVQFSPVGNTCMNFALQAAYVGLVEDNVRAWLRDRMRELDVSLRVSPSSIFCVQEMDPFRYLRD